MFFRRGVAVSLPPSIYFSFFTYSPLLLLQTLVFVAVHLLGYLLCVLLLLF